MLGLYEKYGVLSGRIDDYYRIRYDNDNHPDWYQINNLIALSTERFRYLGKLNLLMVVRFKAQANLHNCPSCL